MGFIPSGFWNFHQNVEIYANDHEIDLAGTLALVRLLEKKQIKAITKSVFGGIDIIIDGISDNTWGVLILEADSGPPEEGQTTVNGFKYSIVRKVGDGFYYYQTT